MVFLTPTDAGGQVRLWRMKREVAEVAKVAHPALVGRQPAALQLLDVRLARVRELADQPVVAEDDLLHLREEQLAVLVGDVRLVVDEAGDDLALAGRQPHALRQLKSFTRYTALFFILFMYYY